MKRVSSRSTLADMLTPDVELSPESPEIGFVHRRTKDAEIYFLANSSNVRESVKASFRISGMQAEWWDPMSGGVTPASIVHHREGRTDVSLELEPYGGRFLVFSKQAVAYPPRSSLGSAATGSQRWMARHLRNCGTIRNNGAFEIMG